MEIEILKDWIRIIVLVLLEVLFNFTVGERKDNGKRDTHYNTMLMWRGRQIKCAVFNKKLLFYFYFVDYNMCLQGLCVHAHVCQNYMCRFGICEEKQMFSQRVHGAQQCLEKLCLL